MRLITDLLILYILIVIVTECIVSLGMYPNVQFSYTEIPVIIVFMFSVATSCDWTEDY